VSIKATGCGFMVFLLSNGRKCFPVLVDSAQPGKARAVPMVDILAPDWARHAENDPIHLGSAK